MKVTDEIRTTVKQRLKELNLNHSELGRRIGMEQPNIARALNGRSGNIPDTWQKILDEIGLKLVAVPKGDR